LIQFRISLSATATFPKVHFLVWPNLAKLRKMDRLKKKLPARVFFVK